MSNKSSHAIRSPRVPGNELSIISRREIEPLLARARQVLTHYDEAVGCYSSVLDKNGRIVRSQDNRSLFRFCEFCRKYRRSSGEGWQGTANPCEKIHANALTESRQGEGTHIYTCHVGFVYWTSPLYRNGRYAGALTAGQVLLGDKQIAVEKSRAVCKDEAAVEKFIKMLEEVHEKSHDEIQAMAMLLGVCAEEISEKNEDSGGMIRRMARQEEMPKEPQQLSTNDDLPSPQGINMEVSLEKERMLLAAFRRGDIETGSRILNELMNSTIMMHSQNFDIIRFRAIELVVLLSRAAAGEFTGSDAILEVNNRYLKRIQESATTEELIENLQLAAKRMADKIFSFQGMRHASVLRRAERYIWDNYTRKLSLEEIAKASGLSAPYFCSVFKEEMGENLSRYLNRLRVERAAGLLTDTGKSLNQIAHLCGFEDQSWFSKIFKSFTGVSPGKFREHGCQLSLRTGKKHVKSEDSFQIGAQNNYEGQIKTSFG